MPTKKTLKPCPEGKTRNPTTNRCVNIEKPQKKAVVKPKVSSIEKHDDLKLAADIQKDYLKQRAQLGKLEAKLEDCKNRHVELMRTMAKCHEDLKELKRKAR